MSARAFELARLWGVLTGLALAGWAFGELSLGLEPSEPVLLLLTAIGGFELYLTLQDKWLEKRKGRGHG